MVKKMSLLFQELPEEIISLSKKIYERHFEADPKLADEYDNRQKRMMYNDILYNLGYLDASVRLGDEKIFTEYSVWLYRLLCHLIRSPTSTRKSLKAFKSSYAFKRQVRLCDTLNFMDKPAICQRNMDIS